MQIFHMQKADLTLRTRIFFCQLIYQGDLFDSFNIETFDMARLQLTITRIAMIESQFLRSTVVIRTRSLTLPLYSMLMIVKAKSSFINEKLKTGKLKMVKGRKMC